MTRLAWAISLVVVACSLSACIPPTSDPVSVGEFCIGAPDCAGSALLARDSVGRSRIDFAVTNLGDEEATIAVQALVPLSSPTSTDAGSDAGSDAGTVSTVDRIVIARTFQVGPGEERADRLAATELGTRRNIELAIACDGCSARLEYVFESEPLECADEDDCSSGWLCDEALGRCAECLSAADCLEDQTCTESGRCLPEVVEAGCATGNSDAPIALPVILLVFGLVLTRGVRRRRRFALAATCAVLAFSSSAFAAAPGAGISLGAGPRWITGELGPVTERGIGISLGQELRWDYVGLGVQLNWATFLTTQEPPPFSRNIQVFDFTVGPRAYLPLGDFELVFATDYKRIGLAANSLVRLTGTDNGYHAFGGLVGTRWDGLGVELRLDVGLHHMSGLGSQILMVELAAALTGGR